MPLKDHFHLPWSEQNPWEGFHSAWANTMVRHLNGHCLPRRFRAMPHVHLGSFVETDLATLEQDSLAKSPLEALATGANGNEPAPWSPPGAVRPRRGPIWRTTSIVTAPSYGMTALS